MSSSMKVWRGDGERLEFRADHVGWYSDVIARESSHAFLVRKGAADAVGVSRVNNHGEINR